MNDFADKFIHDTYRIIASDNYYCKELGLIFNIDIWKHYAKCNKLKIHTIDELHKTIVFIYKG